MWPLGHVGHVIYSFINILFISTGIFDDKLRQQILSVGTSANSPWTEKQQIRICWSFDSTDRVSGNRYGLRLYWGYHG
jgi:hypothetical protein